jgi:hypothetical protein
MFGYLAVEVLGQYNDVLELRRQHALFRQSRIPDLGFAHKVKTRTMHQFRRSRETVRAEVDRRSEDALEGSDQSSVLLAARMHAKAFEHLSRSSESDRSTLLLDGESCEEDRNEPILAERNSEFGVPGDLKDKLSVPPLIQQLIFWQTSDGQSAQDERTRTETQILILLFATDADEFDSSRLLELLSRDDEFRLLLAQQLANRSQVSSGARSGARRQ